MKGIVRFCKWLRSESASRFVATLKTVTQIAIEALETWWKAMSTVTYQCWNTQCRNYAGNGAVLTDQHVTIDSASNPHCPCCLAYVRRAAQPNDASRGVVGAAGGAIVGFAIAGPAGAVVGGLLGLVVSGVSGSNR